MIIRVQRLHHYSNYTIGVLYIDGVLQCFTLEDEKRDVKVMSKTRIPAGVYDMRLQRAGQMNTRYAAKYPNHRGMLHVQNVPNFTGIFIHVGNTDLDTAGCILVAQSHTLGRNFIGSSVVAYTRIYDLIATALEKGQKVQIQVVDELH